MLKRNVALLVGVALIGLTGCKNCPVTQEQHDALKAQYAECLAQNTRLKTDLADADSQLVDVQAKLKAANDEVDKYSAMAKALQEARDKMAADQDKLKRMMADLDWLGQGEMRDGESFLVMKNEILFAAGSHELKPRAKEGLDVIAQRLMELPDAKIRVDGHTDGQPIRASRDRYSSNWDLAAKRAEAVRAYLAEKGVPEDRMFIAGFGPNVPRVEPPEPTAAVEENRRVEILLIFGKSGDMQDLLDNM